MKKQKIEPLEDDDYIIKDLKITEIVPNNIDNYLISIHENHQLIILPPNILGIQFKNWKRGRGGVFAKDVLLYTLKKSCGKYVLIKGKDKNFIGRLIHEDELLLFQALKLVDGQIKDSSYMILKQINEIENLTSAKINILDNTEESLQESLGYYPIVLEHPQEEETEYRGNSISLFSSD